MSGASIAAQRFADDTRVFMNRQPSTRSDRRASRDKESKEKALLEKRPPIRGQEYINYGRTIASAQEGTVAYITEQDRFFTDFSAEDKRRRDKQQEMKQEQLTRRRYQLAVAEEERWNRIDQEHAAAEAKQTARSERGVPRNQSSVPYNPLTLAYEPTLEGERLRYSDDKIRYRAALRAERLRGHQTKDGYHPITGEPTAPMRMPQEPKCNF